MGITIERTYDAELIRSIMLHPRVAPWVIDDGSPNPKDWIPELEQRIFLVVKKDGTPIGIFAAEARNHVLYCWHVAFLPAGYGKSAEVSAKLFFDWIWKHTPCVRLIGEVPKYNRSAFWYALRVGMRVSAVSPASYQRFGKLHDLICFWKSRPESE